MLTVAAIAVGCGKTDKSTIALTSSIAPAYANIPIRTIVNNPTVIEPNTNKLRINNTTIPLDDCIPGIDSTNEDIVSPDARFDVPMEHYVIDAGIGGTFSYAKTGSTVSIPANALINKNGDPIIGMVDISYREFHTQKEIFFSGIPMHYHVDDERQYFESAGMIDIQASQNNEEVFLKNDKAISFKMSTDNTNEEVKLYELDKKNKKWKDIGAAPIVNTPVAATKTWGPVYITEEKKDRNRTPLQIYIKDYEAKYDFKSNERKYKLQFRMQVTSNRSMKTKENKQDFKNVAKFNRAIFEVEGIKKYNFNKLLKSLKQKKTQSKDKKDRYYYSIPANVTILNVNEPYLTLEMTYEGQTVVLAVKVVYDSPTSKNTRKKIFETVSTFPIDSFDGRFYNKREFTSCIDRYDSISPSSFGEDWNKKYLVQREFQSKNFGMINCDQPHKMPDEMIANACFFVNDEEVKPNFAILIDFKQRCQFSYYQYAFSKFGFNPDAKNFIFTILQDGTVAFIMPDDFKSIQKNGTLKIPLQRVTMESFEKVMEDLFPTKTHHSYET
jgi:hypothetical protein